MRSRESPGRDPSHPPEASTSSHTDAQAAAATAAAAAVAAAHTSNRETPGAVASSLQGGSTSQALDAVEMSSERYSRHSNAIRLTHTSRANVPSPCLTPLHPLQGHHRIAAGAARGGDRQPPRRDHHRIAAGAGRRRPPVRRLLRRRDHHRIVACPDGAAGQVTRRLPRRGYRRIATSAAGRRPPTHPPSPPRPPPDRRRPRLSSRSRPRRPRPQPDRRWCRPPSRGPPPMPRRKPDRRRRHLPSRSPPPPSSQRCHDTCRARSGGGLFSTPRFLAVIEAEIPRARSRHTDLSRSPVRHGVDRTIKKTTSSTDVQMTNDFHSRTRNRNSKTRNSRQRCEEIFR